ncbi:MAG: GNAT family N-acetyltransferase [Chitinophagaceae bacterium]
MIIEHKQNGNKGMFYVGDENNILAEMIYTTLGSDKIIIEHTEVSEELRGQNIGFQLVQAAVEYARMNNLKILLVCPFAKSVFDKKPEFIDVLA